MSSYVLGLEQIDRTNISVVGGKGAHLGELSRIEDVSVPAGFCLGEALISGPVKLDVHEVRDIEVVTTVIATKPRAIYAAAAVGRRNGRSNRNDSGSRR